MWALERFRFRLEVEKFSPLNSSLNAEQGNFRVLGILQGRRRLASEANYLEDSSSQKVKSFEWFLWKFIISSVKNLSILHPFEGRFSAKLNIFLTSTASRAQRHPEMENISLARENHITFIDFPFTRSRLQLFDEIRMNRVN